MHECNDFYVEMLRIGIDDARQKMHRKKKR